MHENNLGSDLAEARKLSAAMITAALTVAGEPGAQPWPVYQTARNAAEELAGTPGGAQQCVLTMFLLASCAAGLLKWRAQSERRQELELWQELLAAAS